MRNHRAWKIVGSLLAAALAVGLLPAGAGAGETGSEVSASGYDGDALTLANKVFAARPDLRARMARMSARATSAPVTAVGGVSASATTLSVPDPGGDSAARSDIRAVGARLTTTSLRLSIHVPAASNPMTDPLWVPPKTGALWAIDAGGDGTIERIAALFMVDRRFIGFVVGNTATPNILCAGNARFDTGGYLSMQVPTACVGSPSQITFGTEFYYDYSASAPTHRDFAPDGDAMAGLITAATTRPTPAGGILLGSNSAPYGINIGGVPSNQLRAEYVSIGTPRGIGVTPDGGHGYVVAGSGRLFGVGFVQNNLAPRAYGVKTWPGQDVARGVAIRPNGSAGLVVDGFGNL